MTALAELVARRVSPLCAPSLVADVIREAYAVGAAVSPIDLLPGGEFCLPLWDELCAALASRGWKALVGWDESTPRLVLMPAGATEADYDACRQWWLTVESYGDGTVNIHGAAPTDPDAVEIDWRTFDTVSDALAALDG